MSSCHDLGKVVKWTDFSRIYKIRTNPLYYELLSTSKTFLVEISIEMSSSLRWRSGKKSVLVARRKFRWGNYKKSQSIFLIEQTLASIWRRTNPPQHQEANEAQPIIRSIVSKTKHSSSIFFSFRGIYGLFLIISCRPN